MDRATDCGIVPAIFSCSEWVVQSMCGCSILEHSHIYTCRIDFGEFCKIVCGLATHLPNGKSHGRGRRCANRTGRGDRNASRRHDRTKDFERPCRTPRPMFFLYAPGCRPQPGVPSFWTLRYPKKSRDCRLGSTLLPPEPMSG